MSQAAGRPSSLSDSEAPSRFGHDAHAHSLDCGLRLFDLRFQFLHDVPQPGRPGGGLCEYDQGRVPLDDAGETRYQLSGQLLCEPLLPEGLAAGLIRDARQRRGGPTEDCFDRIWTAERF